MFKASVAATEWEVELHASVHDTRRTCDTGTPVALAKEQRISVMLVSERMVLRASKTTSRTDWSDEDVDEMDDEEDDPRPSPRPIARAETTARRRQQKPTNERLVL